MTSQERSLVEPLPVASATLPGQRWQRWLRAARVVWVVVALILLGIFVANIPFYYQSETIPCAEPDPSNCPTGQLSPAYGHILSQFHLSVTVVAFFLATLTTAVSVAYWVVGALIFWRKSQEWMGLFVSSILILLAASNIFGLPTSQTPSLLFYLDNGFESLLPPTLFLFFFTFPTGRFTPRWTLIPFALVLATSLPFVPAPVALALLPLIVAVQIYRYVRVYNSVQRQQTKWFVFGFGVGALSLALYYLLGAVVPGLDAPDSWYQLLNPFTWLELWTLLLLSISMAILRYRLWDIDALINKTLVYGSLTTLLVALYVGLILAAQALLHTVNSTLDKQPIAIVVSTLVIAALFQPARHRLQNVIDRRFYRRKYDAEQALAAFSAVLRNEVDLAQVREHLLEVVQETMQPAHVSLWLSQPSRAETASLQVVQPAPEEAALSEAPARQDILAG